MPSDGAVEALDLLGAAKADLAIGRGDLEMPTDAQTVAIVRKNFVALWATSGLADKRRLAPKIKEIRDLAGHRVGVIGRTTANVALLIRKSAQSLAPQQQSKVALSS